MKNKYTSNLEMILVVLGIGSKLGQSQDLALHWVFSFRSPFGEKIGELTNRFGVPCKLALVWPLELGVSSLCLSSEKGIPASFLVSSSAIGFPARPESPGQEGADAVGTGCSFQHRTLYAHLPVSLGA
uniref:Uncharacterized protein n=1 Tax=Rousettus aegyptiacus TaxID=9407 RepID=A0A7J8FIX7_ROUAE|nr:hypothetical protein HJG63_011974 [Rousettus aegyptiacus]